VLRLVLAALTALAVAVTAASPPRGTTFAGSLQHPRLWDAQHVRAVANARAVSLHRASEFARCQPGWSTLAVARAEGPGAPSLSDGGLVRPRVGSDSTQGRAAPSSPRAPPAPFS
jgi:hypothetical protein